ncbi:MAG: hypothetical protein K0R57_2137 [Paenibacillaceae bacterium]|jgi:hypothetical protein|nr:hypothetical protein [Paenibacillaceae bacterium]
MPQWLCNQLTRAFQSKNRRQIRMLNDCWFFYRNKSDREFQEGRKQQKP